MVPRNIADSVVPLPEKTPGGLSARSVGQGDSANLPDALRREFGLSWSVRGSGVLSWSVFRLYRATLHVVGTYDPTKPFIIDLQYLRRIASDQIVLRSLEEMRRLLAPAQNLPAHWQQALEALIPDVESGSRLVGVFEPGRRVVFFSGSARLGEIADPEFTALFAAIWLDPRTRSPELRRALLGESMQ